MHAPRTQDWVRGASISGQWKVPMGTCRVSASMTRAGLGLLIAGWLALSVSGCSAPANREQLAKQVLAVDPNFSSVLDQHQDLTSRIETYQRELALKRATIEHSIADLRKELETAVTNVRAKIDAAKAQLDPERKRLEVQLTLAGEELRAKQAQRANIGRSIAKLRKTLKEAGQALTEPERATQEGQLEEHLREGGRLDREISGSKEHIRLLKLKLLLIRF